MNKNLILKSGDCINETYEISVFIGKGAFGEVYRVEHKFFKKSQVMKVFNPNYVERSSLEKVLEEGQILTRLIHQNLVKVFEINTFKKNGKDYFFMTMNFVSGETLFDLLKREVHLSISTSFSIMKDVLSGHPEGARGVLNVPAIGRDGSFLFQSCCRIYCPRE